MQSEKESAEKKSAEKKSEQSLLGVYGERDVTLVRGEGSYVWDSEGRKYLDCVSGVAVNALGHGHPAVLTAIGEQSGKFLHASNLYVLPTQRDLAKKLTDLSGFAAVFFGNSGTEANEGAFKFARKYFSASDPERTEIVSFSDSFHGRTYAALAATGQPKMWQGFAPLPAGFVNVPANDVEALKKAVGPRTAAILYEPVQAEGGVVNMKPETAAALRELQAAQGVLLIADEIQTGLWRTGTFLGSEALGLKPDLVTLAKPLGGGLPLGAILLSGKIAAALKAGDHGSTFGGNPVACAAGLAVLGVLSDPAFQADYQDRIALLRGGLEELITRKVAAGIAVGPLRGRGFLIGMQWPREEGVGAVQKRLRDEGVLAHRAGADVLRLLPPLTFSRAEIAELLTALDRALV